MMAPGMGLNALFTYPLVLGRGVPWSTALGVVFLSGIVFLCFTWLGFRERLVRANPISLRYATSVGIGLFIAFIGLQHFGLIVHSDAVLVKKSVLSPFRPAWGSWGFLWLSFWKQSTSRERSC
jgi:AGZA family xanthine/uracil permease-like MFS transporter